MKKLALATISILAACLFSTPANSASFDCNSAAAWVEKTICKNPELSKLDETMAEKYKQNLADTSDKDYKNNLIIDQRTWLKFQRNTCTETKCLIREYKEYVEEKANYGVAWNYASELNQSELPSKNAFGKFSKASQISMYNPEMARWDDTGEVINTLSINSVSNKPYLSIIDGVFIFTNGHTCDIGESKAIWSQNHWVISDDQQGEAAELRLYPALYKGNTQLLLRDMDNRYRRLHCGMRGYFDGMVLEREVG
ncbi:lysozyme inhibitor LprI family protein [Psychrobacter sp. M13]|uniref:lysozyme inhibitor LprI family protein n=1 Tax=Psychrobacter sp. M13 TaxID=3067275 RepID=UPI00273C0939|nr:lysozyme inhibitor LprI family protein [Psychrobacter sp. M13]WLP94762.1 lysozyme inhibitor LprI family protein [Psychrobacter sp. M13]